MNRTLALAPLPLVLTGALLLTGALSAPLQPGSTTDGSFDHTHKAWTEILEGALKDGLVDYKTLREEPKALDAYLAQLESTTPAHHERWTKNERYAFWINAYNAYTIQLIRDEGPTKSIKKLGGLFSTPWEKKFIPLEEFDPEKKGKKLMLDEIEHDILRPTFKDGRVHAAVNCASMGCPPLRAEAYRGEDLDEQLDDQVAQWLADEDRNQVRPKDGRIRVSKIFDWFDEDFGKSDPKVVRWIADHVADEELAKTLRAQAGKLKIKYLDYDWGINAQDGRR